MVDREKYLERLQEYVGDVDYEVACARAEQIICELLTELGYADVVAVWDQIGREPGGH